MFKFTLFAILAAAAAQAQFVLKIAKPLPQEFQGVPVSVEIQAPPGTPGPNIQLSVCAIITGLPPCDSNNGTILLNAPFTPPDQTYNVTIPQQHQGGVNKLIVGHIINSGGGTPKLRDETFIEVFLGSPP